MHLFLVQLTAGSGPFTHANLRWHVKPMPIGCSDDIRRLMSNIVYIGTSLDGYISAPDGGLDWLSYVPIPEGDDLGFSEFMKRVDAVVMGRKTFETVLGFGAGWHYPRPGIVLSSTLKSTPIVLPGELCNTHGTLT